MSQKRKLDEYHDPDYPKNTDKKQKSPTEDRDARISEIIKREFKTELEEREKEVIEIENRIAEAKKQLQNLKYAAVASFYKRGEISKVVHEERDALEEESLPKDQIALHPAIKKLVGKTPRSYSELITNVPTRRAARDAVSLLRKVPPKGKKEEKASSERVEVAEKDKEEEVQPEITSLNSSRGRNQEKHVIVVGNTSKYIGESKLSSSVSHKWLVYVATKSHQPLEKLVERVRFFLHPTYQPNDCVDIDAPPYKISRYGWGEFTIRVQLHFLPEIKQKPIQIYHRVKLDEKHTGLETVGAETIAELWLNRIADLPKESVSPEKRKTPQKIPENANFVNVKSPHELFGREEINLKGKSRRELQESLPSHLYDHCYTRNSLQSGKARLAELFNSIPFTNVRAAAEFLLRRLPLVCPDFQQDSPSMWSFPFVCLSEIFFKNLHSAKRFSNEWFRAKFICRLLCNHPNLRNSNVWTTKEIILFSRKHCYVPRSIRENASSPDFKNFLKEEIKWEKFPSSTSTTSSKIRTWLSFQNLPRKKDDKGEEFIDIEDIPESKNSTRRLENPSISTNSLTFFNLTNVLGSQSCEDPDDALTAMRVILKIFLEDLLRRSAANVIDDSPIQTLHIKSSLLSRKEFDFLTNHNLGKNPTQHTVETQEEQHAQILGTANVSNH
ncbi:uncharacterized protein LOC129794196 [Lutzomyia longipalpis]|uniref:uncharacterized protein LOC129794196 n=1 Tax=Lutzomyia longipalpis TaxID=7200 RepID=UPI002483F6A7|nr:uncharacterized protein LOC129794196 [Lutzomyia longipalpis]